MAPTTTYNTMLHAITMQAGACLTEVAANDISQATLYEEIEVPQYRVPGTWYFVRPDLANTAHAKERNFFVGNTTKSKRQQRYLPVNNETSVMEIRYSGTQI
ncbi:hypothetical protein E4U24_005654 [Claviceps purpurea]|nr:hypothetical protein E4U24_005654 [Claviceps purpurea]